MQGVQSQKVRNCNESRVRALETNNAITNWASLRMTWRIADLEKNINKNSRHGFSGRTGQFT